jgi:hypothetical protein
MRLTLETSVLPYWRPALRRGFELIAKRLGITDYEGTLAVSVVPWLGPGTEAMAGPIRSDTNARRAIAGQRPIEYELIFAAWVEPKSLLPVFAHELVHIKQWVTGEFGLKLYGHELGKTYMNVRTDNLDIPYSQQPWEIEAFSRMYELGDYAKLKIQEEQEQLKEAA